jgi:uncharacterized protein
MLTKDEGQYLVKIARETIENYVRGRRPISKREDYPRSLDDRAGIFCTLTKEGKLRGCVGFTEPINSLIKGVQEAVREACNDPRFDKVRTDELSEIKIEISVLSPPEKIVVKHPADYIKVIIPGEDGLILKYGYRSGLFLPQVWEELPDPGQFLDNLCLKAGIAPGLWCTTRVEIFRFKVQIFKE